MKSPVATTGSSLPLYSFTSSTLWRISLLPSLRAGGLTWSRCVFRCRSERPEDSKSAQFAERTTLEFQLDEYLCGVSLSQKPPETSGRRWCGSKKIAFRLGRPNKQTWYVAAMLAGYVLFNAVVAVARMVGPDAAALGRPTPLALGVGALLWVTQIVVAVCLYQARELRTMTPPLRRR